MSTLRPPRFWERLLEWALPAGLSGEGTLGDLAERYDRMASHSPLRAQLWYAAQALSVASHHLVRGGPEERMASSTGLVMDVKWSMRMMRRHPAFALAVVGVLGVGLGSSVAVFSVVDGTLRDASWWSEPDRTVAIWPSNRFSFGQMDLYGLEQQVYRAVGGYVESAYALSTPGGESRSVNGMSITPALFREFAARPLLGRGLSDEDAQVGAERVVVVGEGLWRRDLGGRDDVVGTRIEIAGGPATVVGVLSGQRAPGLRSEVWLPHFMDPRDDDFWRQHDLTAVGVLAEGATLVDAGTSLAEYTRRLTDLFPQFFPVGYGEGVASVEPVDQVQQRNIATPLKLLLGGTLVLVLVTALNAGSLLLGRAIQRRRELAVRAALGASRAQVIRQLTVEGVVLSGCALAVGLVFATWSGEWIAGLFVDDFAVARSSILSPTVLLFSSMTAVAAGIVLNGVPVLHFLRSQRARLQVAPNSGALAQRGLVALQASLATMLLISATLLIATVQNLRSVPLGFEPAGVYTMELSPPTNRIETTASARELYERLTAGVRGVRGVEAVGLTGWLPLRTDAPPTPVNVESAPVDPAQAIRAALHRVDAGFFEVMGIAPTSGRLLGTDERARDPSAVLVNESLARQLWPEGFTPGVRVAIDPHAWEEFIPVVGVVPDVRARAITGANGPALYASLAEGPAPSVTLVVRSGDDPEQLLPALRSVVASTDPLVPIRRVAPMAEVVRAAYSTAWVMMGLLVVLAGLATALGTVGIYAVLAHYVASNTKSIGIRMALGAGPARIVGGLLGSGLAVAGIGIVVGGLAAVFSTRLLESMLFEVSRSSPWVYVVAACALLAASALAAALPAVRASRLSPSTVLRAE